MKALAPRTIIEAGDAAGAIGYALIKGLGGLVFVGVFFKNFLLWGSPGTCCQPGRSTSPASPSGSR